MKIVLIRPPEDNRIWAGIPRFFNDGIFLWPPLGLMQLKAYIEKYSLHEVIIYDSLMHGASYDKVAGFVKNISPKVAGISTFTHSLADVVKTAEAIKKAEPSVHVVIGGPHTYTFSDECASLLNLGCIDSAVLGDGEIAFSRMLCALDENKSFAGIEGIMYKDKAGKMIKNSNPQYITDLDSLPFPSRNIYGFEQYYTPASSGKLMATIITSRGCPHGCKFCNVQKKYRARSVINVADEMEACHKAGFKEIFFIDDTFNATAERVIRLSEEILKRKFRIKWGFKARCDNVNEKMLYIAKQAGCFRIHYGVETGLPAGLSSIDKNLTLEVIKSAFDKTKNLGIRTTAYFMIGCPYEKNVSDINETINFARSLKADFAVFSLMSPYPDTVFYKEGVEKGLIDPLPWDIFMKKPGTGKDLPTCWEEHFSKADLIKFFKKIHREFYYRPGAIFNILRSIKNFKEFKRIVVGGLSLIKLEFSRNV